MFHLYAKHILFCGWFKAAELIDDQFNMIRFNTEMNTDLLTSSCSLQDSAMIKIHHIHRLNRWFALVFFKHIFLCFLYISWSGQFLSDKHDG